MRTAWRSEGSSAGNGRIEVKALSVRGITGSCLGVGGTFSVRRDVYGYVWGPMSRTLSLKSHLKLISGKAINLSLILERLQGEWNRCGGFH